MQQRLDDEGCDVLGPVPHPVFESSERARLPVFGRLVAIEGVREGEDGHLAHQTAEQGEEAGASPERHGPQSVAVVAAIEGNERATPRLAAIGPILERDLERDLDGRRAVVGKECSAQIRRKQQRQRGRKIDGGLMGEACEHHMLEPVGLACERLIELGVRVAVRAGPPGGHEVEDLAPLRIEQRGAVGAREQQRLGLSSVLGEGMPDVAPVSRDDVTRKRVSSQRLLGKPVFFRCVVHGRARASFRRSSSGSTSSRLARVTAGSQGISAITCTWP